MTTSPAPAWPADLVPADLAAPERRAATLVVSLLAQLALAGGWEPQGRRCTDELLAARRSEAGVGADAQDRALAALSEAGTLTSVAMTLRNSLGSDQILRIWGLTPAALARVLVTGRLDTGWWEAPRPGLAEDPRSRPETLHGFLAAALPAALAQDGPATLRLLGRTHCPQASPIQVARACAGVPADAGARLLAALTPVPGRGPADLAALLAAARPAG